MRSQSSVLGRVIVGGIASIALALMLAACGHTKRSPIEGTAGDGGADGAPASPPSAGAAATGAGGSVTEGGTTMMTSGGEGALGPGGAAGAASDCVDGAACTCGDSMGVLDCNGASGGGHCTCPPASACEAPSGSCFEPCGGNALGLWVLEETCFPGADTGARCAGGAISGTSSLKDLKVVILENEPVKVLGSENVDLRAQVPLRCLGIESIDRCKDAQFYASPLFFSAAAALNCEPSACGFCECSGSVTGGGIAEGTAWQPGSSTIAFGSIELPYCVEDDTMWVGGGTVAGEPRVAYKFRRRSCIGAPLPCGERKAGECDMSGDCQPGRCSSSGDSMPACAEIEFEETCSSTSGCKWVPGGCWGTAAQVCDYAYCEETPGCSWGAPQARCGGYPSSCLVHDTSSCSVAGCSVRTCDVPDGWNNIDKAPCAELTPSACAKANGCTVSGASCKGTTKCAMQTDASVCAALGCAVYEQPTCGGYPTTHCSDLSVEACSSEPGCRLEW